MELKPIKNHCMLLGIILFFIIANLIWTKMDQAPPMWDQSQYLLNSEVLYHTLTNKGVIAFVKAFASILETKAPLITILPIPLYILFGNTFTSALYINLLFVIISSFYFYKFGALIAGEKEALLSIFILNTFPLIFGMSREFLVEYGQMTLVILWMYFIVKSNCFENGKFNYTLGIIFGLGMLMKITYVLYVLFPTALLLISKMNSAKNDKRAIVKNLFITSLTGALVAGTWYLKNIKHVIQFAYTASYGNMAKQAWGGDVYSLKTVFNYWLSLINNGISAYYFILLACLVPVAAVASIKNRFFFSVKKIHVYFLLIWFCIPFIVLTFGVGKDYRYIAPILPALALMISIVLIQLSARQYGAVLLFILLLFPTINYFYVSFSPKSANLQWKQFVLFHNWLAYAHPPVKERWREPNEKLVKFLYADAVRTNNNYALTTLLIDHNYLNQITSTYYSIKNNFSIAFKTNDFFTTGTTDEIVARIEKSSSYIITKSGYLGPDFLNTKNVQIVPLLNRGLLNFKPIETMPLPDNTFLTIYKRKVDAALVYPNLAALKGYHFTSGKAVNFSNTIRLLDYKVEKAPDGRKIVLYWECLNTTDLHYIVSVHIKANDRDSYDILQADHDPNREHPTFMWRRGEVIKDIVSIATALPENFHVYVGLYEATTWSRLLVKDKPKDAADNIYGVKIM